MRVDESHLLLIESCIRSIMREYQILYWNKNQEEYEDTPLYNTGERLDFSNFHIYAYDWEPEEGTNVPNFEYKGLKFYWYKHIGRGNYAECDEEITVDFLSKMMLDCMETMKDEI